MAKIEVTLPDRVESEISRLVEQGEFLNRDQAIEELLSLGVSSYETEENTRQEVDDEIVSQMMDDQQDPAMQDEQGGDEYSF